VRIPVSFFLLRWQTAIAEAAAVLSALTLIGRFIAKRRHIQKSRKLSDQELLNAGLLLRPSKPWIQITKLLGL
jgi:hypothetical protein